MNILLIFAAIYGFFIALMHSIFTVSSERVKRTDVHIVRISLFIAIAAVITLIIRIM